jgi:hypothetical protein
MQCNINKCMLESAFLVWPEEFAPQAWLRRLGCRNQQSVEARRSAVQHCGQSVFEKLSVSFLPPCLIVTSVAYICSDVFRIFETESSFLHALLVQL